MFSGPVRGGTRGGAAEFKWDDVKNDKDREHYLGHSVMAAAGRWQKNKDIHWYARDQETSADAAARARADEIRKVKEAEEDALAVALGFEPAVRLTDEERELQRLAKEQEKVLKAARKAERHAEKLVKKEIKDQLKAERRLAREDSASSKPANDKPREGSSSRHTDRDRDSRRRREDPERHDDRDKSHHHRERDDGDRQRHRHTSGEAQGRPRSRSPAARRDRDRAADDRDHRRPYERERSPPHRREQRREDEYRGSTAATGWKGREDDGTPSRGGWSPARRGGGRRP